MMEVISSVVSFSSFPDTKALKDKLIPQLDSFESIPNTEYTQGIRDGEGSVGGILSSGEWHRVRTSLALSVNVNTGHLRNVIS